jgi:hypothetical protein
MPMHRRAGWLGAAAAAVVLVGGAWYLGKRAARPGAGADAAEVAALRDRLDELERQQGRQQLATRQMGAVIGTVARSPKEADGEGKPAAATEPAAPRPSPQEQFKTLEGRFAAENVDVKWAPETESTIHKVMAQFEGANLVGTSCRSTMCRVEIKFGNRDAREDFESRHFEMAPFSNTHIWMQRLRDDDGSLHSTLLVSRGGAPLTVM